MPFVVVFLPISGHVDVELHYVMNVQAPILLLGLRMVVPNVRMYKDASKHTLRQASLDVLSPPREVGSFCFAVCFQLLLVC